MELAVNGCMPPFKSIAWGCAMAALLWACSSANTQHEASDAGKAGSADGGSQAAGSGSGGSSSGGSSSGGSGGSSTAGRAGSAAGGAGSTAGCHDASECPSKVTPPFGGISMCLVPGQVPPSGGCGAPQWCGQCSCPPQPQAPSGTGTPCQTSDDCPKPSAGSATASVCNAAAGACTACAQDSDCPSSAPVCGQVNELFVPGAMSFRVCNVCAMDSDCPSERPHCQASYGIAACVACLTTADCQSGTCSNGTCTPVCSPTQSCGVARQCNAQQRCEALSCQSDADCPTNFNCSGGHCAQRSCTSDAVCDGNCVNGFCYESLGTCYELLQAA